MAGTKDTQLAFRTIKAAWDKDNLRTVKLAYKSKYPSRGSLLIRIGKDTSKDLLKLLTALVNSDVPASK